MKSPTDEEIEKFSTEGIDLDDYSECSRKIGRKEGAKWARGQQPKWISVNELLPEETHPVLWCRVPVEEPYYCGCMLDVNFEQDYYTHWQELPNGPESREN